MGRRYANDQWRGTVEVSGRTCDYCAQISVKEGDVYAEFLEFDDLEFIVFLLEEDGDVSSSFNEEQAPPAELEVWTKRIQADVERRLARTVNEHFYWKEDVDWSRDE